MINSEAKSKRRQEKRMFEGLEDMEGVKNKTKDFTGACFNNNALDSHKLFKHASH